jgi:predicted RNA binding protein YcfA (HicA-like mRNA interferase family)
MPRPRRRTVEREKPKRRPLPPLTADDFIRVLHALGYDQVKGTKHLAFEHPTRPGKVNIDAKWTGVKVGHITFKGVLAQMRITRAEFERLFRETR